MSEILYDDFGDTSFRDLIFGIGEAEAAQSDAQPVPQPAPTFETRLERRDYERSQDARWRRSVETVANVALVASSLVRAGIDFPYRNAHTLIQELDSPHDDGTGYDEYIEAAQRSQK